MSSVNPEYRLRNFARALRGLLMGRRLSADSEKTGVVDLSNYAKKCERAAESPKTTLVEIEGQSTPEMRTLRRIADEFEIACRLAVLLETMPRTKERIDEQCDYLEKVETLVQAALKAESRLEETPEAVNLTALAKHERNRFKRFFDVTGDIHTAPTTVLLRDPVVRALRRAMLDHEWGTPFELSVSADGELTYTGGDQSVDTRGEAITAEIPRSENEPAEVKKALNMREATNDEALRDFLLVKAVDEALAAVLAPRFREPAMTQRARTYPRKPGKRGGVRPESVAAKAEGWNAEDAARAIEKLADRRIGPEWARVPKGAYLLRLLVHEDDDLAADLLALGPALRQMERGEPVEDTADVAARALMGLIGLL
ncbi:MAG: hypothetical protein V3T86_09535 [Planctomycetota bacterium]